MWKDMKTDSPLYNELNKAWKSTCKIVFKEEVGELKEFEPWLSEYMEEWWTAKSIISGKEVYLMRNEYGEGSRFIGFDEIDYSKKFDPLNINEIKDIDSIVRAVQDRAIYSGNIVKGNSKFVEESSNISDSFYVYKSFNLHESQKAAFERISRGGTNIFGGNGASSNFMIKGLGVMNSNRCFEYFMTWDCSDIYYSTNLTGCSDCMFCFSLKSKRRAIGNLELPADKYAEIKKKLLAEIVDELKSKKHAPSLFELISHFPVEKIGIEAKEEPFDIAPVEEAFRKTFKIIFNKDPQSRLDSYREFMFKHVSQPLVFNDTSSMGEVISADIWGGIRLPSKRLINGLESSKLAESPRHISIEEASKLSLKDVSALSKVAFVAGDTREGNNKNVSKGTLVRNAVNCYDGAVYAFSDACAFSHWPRNSSHAFGSQNIVTSSFCICSYESEFLTRTFEADNCDRCSDIYYAHNCENVHDSMFCFNVKNLNHAIGNAPLPQDQYLKIKETIVGQLADELIKKKDLKWGIFNIGCGKK
jgi:hypothetical protein